MLLIAILLRHDFQLHAAICKLQIEMGACFDGHEKARKVTKKERLSSFNGLRARRGLDG
jgi:hypothetical protein